MGILLSTGFFGYVGKNLKVFGQIGLAEAVFIGLLASLVLAASLALYRYWRPLAIAHPSPEAALTRQAAAEPVPVQDHPPVTDEVVVTKLVARYNGQPEAENVPWRVPALIVGERERVTAALVEVERMMKEPTQAFLYNGQILGNFSRIVKTEGPKPLIEMAVRFRETIGPFREGVEKVFKDWATELQIADVSSYSVCQLISATHEPTQNLLRFLEGAPAEWREPEYLRLHVQAVTTPVSILQNGCYVLEREVVEKRIALAKGGI